MFRPGEFFPGPGWGFFLPLFLIFARAATATIAMTKIPNGKSKFFENYRCTSLRVLMRRLAFKPLFVFWNSTLTTRQRPALNQEWIIINERWLRDRFSFSFTFNNFFLCVCVSRCGEAFDYGVTSQQTNIHFLHPHSLLTESCFFCHCMHLRENSMLTFFKPFCSIFVFIFKRWISRTWIYYRSRTWWQ